MQFENLKNITSDHISRNARAIIRFFIYNMLKKIMKKIKKTRPSLFYGHATLQWLPNCSHVLFQPINYNLVTGKPSVNFFLANVLNCLIKFLYLEHEKSAKFVIVP